MIEITVTQMKFCLKVKPHLFSFQNIALSFQKNIYYPVKRFMYLGTHNTHIYLIIRGIYHFVGRMIFERKLCIQ